MRLASIRGSILRVTRYRDVVDGAGIAALLAAEYLTDAKLSGREVVAGCTVSLAIGVLVALRRQLPLVLLAATTLAVTTRAVLPQGGDGVAWAS